MKLSKQGIITLIYKLKLSAGMFGLMFLVTLISMIGFSDAFFVVFNNLDLFMIVTFFVVHFIAIKKSKNIEKYESISQRSLVKIIDDGIADFVIAIAMSIILKSFMYDLIAPQKVVEILDENVKFSIIHYRSGRIEGCKFKSLNNGNDYVFNTSHFSCYFADENKDYDIEVRESNLGFHRSIYLCNDKFCYMPRD